MSLVNRMNPDSLLCYSLANHLTFSLNFDVLPASIHITVTEMLKVLCVKVELFYGFMINCSLTSFS